MPHLLSRWLQLPLFSALLLLGLAGGSCARAEEARSAGAASQAPRVATSRASAKSAAASRAQPLTVLVSSARETDYCDGEKMDSDGFRKTLTIEKPVTLPPAGASDRERVKAVIDAATDGMCRSVMRQLDYELDHGTLHVPPVEGWAGVSIVMCYCEPELELNLVRLPGVERVVWDQE